MLGGALEARRGRGEHTAKGWRLSGERMAEVQRKERKPCRVFCTNNNKGHIRPAARSWLGGG